MKSTRNFEAQIFSRVNPAVKFSVTRYVLAIGIFVGVVAFGVVSTFSLGVDLMPSVTMPVVNISTSYPGSSPAVVDQQVTQVLENAVTTVAGITDINSSSSVGNSRISVSFDVSTDKNAVLQQVSAIVNSIVRRLPSGIQAPVVRSFDANSQPVIQFGVSGGATPLSEVSEWTQNSLTPLLQRVDGVANITYNGAPSRQFQVLLNPTKLKYYSLNPSQIVTAITGDALNQPIGTIITQGTSLTFATQNTPVNLDAIRRILVDSARGLTVKDVAVARDASVDQDYARVNGQPVVLVSVQRTADSNSVAVVAGVKKLLSAAQLPSGYGIVVSTDTTGPIQASIDNTFKELWITLIVVAIIVLLFIGKPNTAFAVILAVPIALSAAPILYKLAGFSFNLVSLLAMVIAIGIVVDDSIVVAENVERYRKMGFSLKESVLKGASEVFSAVVAASLSMLAVLIPVSFSGGFASRYLMQFSLGLAAAVAFSLFEAILFLTVRMAYTPDTGDLHWIDFLRSFGRLGDAMKWGFKAWRKWWGILFAIGLAAAAIYLGHAAWLPALLLYPIVLGAVNYAVMIGLSLFGALHDGTEWIVEKVRDGYGRFLVRMLPRSAVVLAIALVFLGGVALLVAPTVFKQFNFVPNSDAGSMSVNVNFPPGTTQATANKAAALVEGFLATRPEIAVVQSVVGNRAEENLTLVPIERRPGVTSLVQTYRGIVQPMVLKEFPTARVSVGAGGFGGGFGGSSIQLSMVAFNLDLLIQRNASIVAAVQANPYVADVSSSLSDTSLENDFVPDANKLKGTGVTSQVIANLMQVYASGTQASNVVTGGVGYPIMVQIDPTALSSGQTLLDLPVYSSALQTSLQVGQLGSFQLNQKPTSISRYNRQYTGSLNINMKPGAPTVVEMQKMIVDDLKARGLMEGGLSITTGNRYSAASLASQLLGTLLQTFALCFFIAYLVMAAQFNSWRYPIYLLLPVPLAIVGALLVLWLVGGGIDIFGLMGMLMLIGLSAKNAILYLDFVVERLGKMPLKDALVEAATLRFRPIVMTTLTVLVISFPLVFSRGQGAEFGQRMGLVMFGGIVFSAILTFFIVPAAFFAFERKREGSFNEAAEEIAAAAAEIQSGAAPLATGEEEEYSL
jgi:hydrophobic/amphiphilic exporter-1 (mainly G- bacteria), HAE1 family